MSRQEHAPRGNGSRTVGYLRWVASVGVLMRPIANGACFGCEARGSFKKEA